MMKIKVTAYGYLTEVFRKKVFEIENVSDLISLRKKLSEKFPDIKNIEYKIAVNQELIIENVLIDEGSEIVLLPPFAGG